MKFGAFVPQGWRLDLTGIEPGYPQYARMREAALLLESLGYNSLWLYDHFHTVPRALPVATFEVWTACTALAEATSTIRLGQMCGCNIYRNPALLAKITANIDVISQGRLDFGLGAGWYEHEVVAYGYTFESTAKRIKKLDEAVQIISGMWTQDHFQFNGKYYTIGYGKVKNYQGETVELNGAINHPKPLQKPRPPLWIAGGGEKLTLKTVAKYADYSNFGGPLDLVIHKNNVLDQHCANVNRDPAEITRSMNINVFFGSDEELTALGKSMGRTDQEIASLRSMLFPRDTSQLIDTIGTYKEKGRIEYLIVYFPDLGWRNDSAQKFAEEIIPAFQSVTSEVP